MFFIIKIFIISSLFFSVHSPFAYAELSTFESSYSNEETNYSVSLKHYTRYFPKENNSYPVYGLRFAIHNTDSPYIFEQENPPILIIDNIEYKQRASHQDIFIFHDIEANYNGTTYYDSIFIRTLTEKTVQALITAKKISIIIPIKNQDSIEIDLPKDIVAEWRKCSLLSKS